MTNEELEKQSRAAIKAWCDDPSVKLELRSKTGINLNPQIISVGEFNLNDYYYRIAKPKKWYRVAKMVGGNTLTADDELQEASIKNNTSFAGWLDERKYYD